MAKATKACKVCGEDGLQWRRMPNGKWVLFVADPDGDASDIQHVHRVTAEAVKPKESTSILPEAKEPEATALRVKEFFGKELKELQDAALRSKEPEATALRVKEVFGKELQDAALRAMEAAPELKKRKLRDNAKWYEILEAICNALQDGSLESIRVLLIGPPGTGKSTTAEICSNALARIPVHQGMGVEELVGQYHLESGATVWKDDVVTLAMKAGKTIVIDEIDRYSDEIGSIMYGVTDDRPYVKLGAGNIVKANKGFSVIATMNPGVSVLPEAILDRFEVILTAIEPHPMANRFEDAARAGAVANYFSGLPTDTWNWSGKPTVRRMRSFTKYEPIVGRKHALALSFGQAANEVESALSTSALSATKKAGK